MTSQNTRMPSAAYRRAARVAGIAGLAALGAVMPGAHAAFTQGIVTGTIGVVDPPGILDRPGGFVSAGAGYTTGSNPDPGFDLAGAFSPGSSQIMEDSFTLNGVASTSAQYPPSMPAPPTEGASNGNARLGHISFAGRGEQVADFANLSRGAAGAVNAGWVDTLTIDSPGLTGTQAIWLFEVDVNVAFDAEGYNGSATMELNAFVDQANLPFATPGFDDGQFNWPIATSSQHAEWRLQLDFIGQVKHVGIVDTVTFAAPITLGTPFDLGIFALGIGRGSTIPSPPSIGSIGEFDGTARWGGDVGLNTLGGTPIGTYQIASVSGTDWVPAVVPVPGMAWVMALAAAGVLGIRRRRPTGSA